MPRFCAAYGCSNSSHKNYCKDNSVSFHRFPLKEPDRLNQWVNQMKRKHFTPNEHSVLCSDHFEDEDFESTTSSNKRRILKKDAVPTKFTFSISKPGIKRKKTSYQIDALGCNNISTSEYCKKNEISFHHFPLNNNTLLKTWLARLKRYGFKPSSTSTICSEHFENHYFTKNPNGRRCLIRDAVPTKFKTTAQNNSDANGSMDYIRCFVPGCKSECPKDLESSLAVGEPIIHMFPAPKNGKLFERWKIILGGEETEPKTDFTKEFTKDDHVCELHFEEHYIERYFVTKTTEGSVIEVEKYRPSLKGFAVPTMFLNLPANKNKIAIKRLLNVQNSMTTDTEQNSVSSSNLVSAVSKQNKVQSSEMCVPVATEPTDGKITLSEIQNLMKGNSPKTRSVVVLNQAATDKSETSTPKRRKIALPDKLNDSTSSSNLEDSIVSVVYDSFAGSDSGSQQKQNSHLIYRELTANLQCIKRPGKLWSVTCDDEFIIFAKWNNRYLVEKRIVIEKNLGVRVFLKEWEINMTDLIDITSINDVCALLKKVESYNI